jgi:hypothetical protein
MSAHLCNARAAGAAGKAHPANAPPLVRLLTSPATSRDTLSHKAPKEERISTRPRKQAGEVEITVQQATKIAKKFGRRKTAPITVRQADNGAVIVSLPNYAGDTKALLIDKKGNDREL